MHQLLARLIACFALLVCAPVALQAQGAEDIRLFESRIVVGDDGVLTVTETITVNAQGRQIRRGIYRDFPTRYYDPDTGLLRTATFVVRSVTRNGFDEPWHSERMGGGTRVYIGDADVIIPPGIHTYKLVYTSDRQLRYFDGYDEVYWNVTGNAWAFPIRQARAQITLPAGADVLQWAAYTGRLGSTEQNARMVGQTGRTLTIETTRRLDPGEGLSVAVGFPKGFVPEVTRAQSVWRLLRDNLGLLGFLAALPPILIWLIAKWVQVGRDPPRQAVIPRFKAPRGLSPGSISYLYHRGFKSGWRSGASKAFIAAMTSLAVKGRIIIDQTGDDMTVVAAGRGYNAMTSDEQALDTALMAGTKRTEFTKKNASIIRNAIASFRSAITKTHGEVYYTTNRRYVVFAAMALIAAVLFFLIIDRPTADTAVPIIFSGVFGAVGLTLLSRSIASFYGALPSESWFAALVQMLIAVPFTLVPLAMAFAVPAGLVAYVPLLVLATVAVIVLFGWLMPAPTVQGQRLAEEIEGYKLYLSVAEAERMNMVGAPQITPQVYETHLPYAIGLGVEKRWSQAFADALAKAGRTEASYRPGFYRGNAWNTAHIARAAGSMTSAIGSSISSATPSPSSSGSGGGGSSGGGGGGGGGGGW